MSENREQYSCAVLIPALKPGAELTAYVSELLESGIPRVVVIDDGSPADFRPVFDAIEALPGAVVLRHEVNRGKGCALKTAYRYCLSCADMQDIAGVVTADADGQHLVKDVLNVARLTQAARDCIIMGTRNIGLPQVPPRSKLGNRVTSFAFHILYGAELEDTQTGLRGFPRGLLEWCCDIRGERYEYEMNVLIRAVRDGIRFEQTEISTVYFDNNRGSHLKAGRDSWRTFLILISGLGMYAVSAAASAATDVAMFWVSYRFLFAGLSPAVCYLAATVLARILSSLVNFSMNRRYVFRSQRGSLSSMKRYYMLWLGQLLVSYLLLLLLQSFIPLPPVIIKGLVDILLSIASYQIQLRWVFCPDNKEHAA